jgi:RimJ/RimL family protein N-acetyltransferase
VVLYAPAVTQLRDGREVLIRAIEPEDGELLSTGLERLSEESRYRRFLGPKTELTDAELLYLTHVDHHDHEALIAVEPQGDAVAVARFVRSEKDAEAADVAVVVADDWQGQGLGTLIMDRLAERAQAEGIHRFTATVLGTNERVLALLRRTGALQSSETEDGETDLEIELAEGRRGPVLKETLRAAARGELLLRGRD